MYKIYSLCISILLFLQCGVRKQEVYPISYSKPKLGYHFDTIFRTYKGNFTKQYVGGIDLIFKDSTTFIVYTFCGSNELKIVDFASDSLLELQMYNPDFKQLHTTIKEKDIFVLTPDGKIWQYCEGTPNKEPYFDLMTDSIFKNSGLVPTGYKPGSDQYIRI